MYKKADCLLLYNEKISFRGWRTSGNWIWITSTYVPLYSCSFVLHSHYCGTFLSQLQVPPSPAFLGFFQSPPSLHCPMSSCPVTECLPSNYMALEPVLMLASDQKCLLSWRCQYVTVVIRLVPEAQCKKKTTTDVKELETCSLKQPHVLHSLHVLAKLFTPSLNISQPVKCYIMFFMSIVLIGRIFKASDL